MSLNPCWRNCRAHLQIRSSFFFTNDPPPTFCSLSSSVFVIFFWKVCVFFIFEKYIWPLFAYLLRHNWIALFKFQLQQKQKLPKSVGISWGWSSFLREYTISKIANLRPSSGGIRFITNFCTFSCQPIFPATKKTFGRESKYKETFF